MAARIAQDEFPGAVWLLAQGDDDGPLTDTVPAKRAITVEDLLTFTMDFGMLFDNSLPIQRAIDENQLVNGPPVPMTPLEPDEWMRRFGTLPLMHQPGEGWMYNTGSLIQGVLLRRAANQPFDAFVRERITGPLGMHDTDFHVPAGKLDRYAGSHSGAACTQRRREGAGRLSPIRSNGPAESFRTGDPAGHGSI
jgi:CubicO group peptidase (beta-lactamase class C family)